MKTLVVLALDPGPEKTAFIRWDGEGVLDKGIVPNHEIFQTFGHADEIMAVEMIACYGLAVGAEVFRTCLWIGRFLQRWTDENGSENRVSLIPRLDVKIHLCKSARAKDGNVRQAIIDRFGPPGTKHNQGRLYGVSSHVWSALAVGITAHDRLTGKV